MRVFLLLLLVAMSACSSQAPTPLPPVHPPTTTCPDGTPKPCQGGGSPYN